MLHYKPNPSQVRSLNRKEFLKTKENNLKNVRELNKNAQIRKRLQSSQLHTTDHELLQPARKKQNFTVTDGTYAMNIVNTLPKPINESQTRKVLETAKHLVKTSELFLRTVNYQV